MRFEVEVVDIQVVTLLNRLLAITGEEPWLRKFTVLQRQREENEFIVEWQDERHGIELKFLELILQQQKTGVWPVRLHDFRHYQLCGFAAGVVRIYEQLSPAGQRRLRGMLLDGLKPDNNLLALRHEITTAVHLVSRGFDVEMNDLERGSGVDYIASIDGLELEIECKMFTGDLGRKIHRRKVLALHRHLSEMIKQAYASARKGLLIRITVPDRLTCSPNQLAGIEHTLSSGLLAGTAVTQSDHCEVAVVDFDIIQSSFNVSKPEQITRNALEEFVHSKLGRTNRELMILFSPGKRAIVALVDSAKPDEVLKGVHFQLRRSAKGQFTRTRPGILAIQFQELTVDQMENIAHANTSNQAKATGLQIMTSHFLDSLNRTHIHTVAYRSNGRLIEESEGGPNSIREQGIAYYIRNPANPHFDDARCRAFN